MSVSCAVGEVSFTFEHLCEDIGEVFSECEKRKRAKMNVKQVHLLGFIDYSLRFIFTRNKRMWNKYLLY